ncbi:MAG TPA: AI-2E family transporter [Wenzhouxiangella sp.]
MIQRLNHWLHRTFEDPQVAILALSLLGGLLVIVLFGQMLTPVVASLVIAYLLEGGVARLRRLGMPRLMAVIIVFTSFMAMLVFLLFGLLPLVTRQIAAIVQQIPAYVAQAQGWLSTLPERYPNLVSGPETPATADAILQAAEDDDLPLALISQDQLSNILESVSAELVNYGAKLVSLSGVMSMVSLLIFLVLMPVLVFFFLKDKRRLMAWTRAHMPKERGLVSKVWNEVDLQIGNYVRGKVLEIFIVWIVTYVVFGLLGMPYAMLLSMLVGVSVIIPYIGAAVVTIPVALVALIYFGGFTAAFWWVMVAYAVIQILDGNVLVPILFSEVVSLHPVAIITAILIFGGIWGFWGVFFAIPLATVVNAVLRAWPRALSEEHESAA